MHTTYSARQFFGAIIAAIIIAGVAGYVIGRSSVSGPVSGEPINVNNDGGAILQPTDGLFLAKNTLAVDDQAAGNQVAILSASFEEGGGWVAVHEDRDGKPSNVLGAQFFPGGETKGGFVDLLRPTVKGVYYAMLHRDDGDHQFDLSKDAPVTDAAGNAVMMRFVVGGGASGSL